MFKMIKHAVMLSAAAAAIAAGSASAAQEGPGFIDKPRPEALKLTDKWDKVFKQSDKVDHSKVLFVNRFGITLAADLYKPKGANGALPALAVAGPFGAVKEQVSGLYAQTMAERGYLAIAFDPSFTGESGGQPRDIASPDINTEDFSAAVDYLETRNDVDHDKIGIIGICGWGGMALNAAASDPRVKATIVSTMYDMSRNISRGYFDKIDASGWYDNMVKLADQRTKDARSGKIALAGGVPAEVPAGAPQFVKDYHDFYKTKLGYHPRSPGSNGGWQATSAISFMNTPLLTYIDRIRNAVLVIHGEKAHSRYMGEDAFKRLKRDNKELLIIPGANHTDLYYKTDVIPFQKIDDFLKKNLQQA
jgi:fermentation-respiration switch protein FrsA (DUF1100 family)